MGLERLTSCSLLAKPSSTERLRFYLECLLLLGPATHPSTTFSWVTVVKLLGHYAQFTAETGDGFDFESGCAVQFAMRSYLHGCSAPSLVIWTCGIGNNLSSGTRDGTFHILKLPYFFWSEFPAFSVIARTVAAGGVSLGGRRSPREGAWTSEVLNIGDDFVELWLGSAECHFYCISSQSEKLKSIPPVDCEE